MALSDDYRALLDTYQTAVGMGDTASIGGLFTEDAIFLAPDQKALYGPVEVVADYAASLGDGYEVKMHIENLHDCGAFCFGSGTFEYDGGAGKWLHVLKRQDDQSLLIHRLCWN